MAGVDIGGTKTLALLVDGGGEVVAQARRATLAGGEGLLATVIGALTDVAAAAGIAPGALVAAGVGVPGVVHPVDATLRHAVNLGVGDDPVDLAGALGSLVGGPVTVANDVNQATLGAAELLATDADLAYLSIGTGVAAGFMLGGEVRVGARGVAGELGHLPVDPYGPWCECGQRGCLEQIVSGPAIARRWARAEAQRGDAGALFAAAAAGDDRAIAVRDDVGRHLAAAVGLIAQTVDPELIVLGGGVAEAGAPLLQVVRTALHHRAAESPLVASLALADRVAIVPDAALAGALGAARSARSAVVE